MAFLVLSSLAAVLLLSVWAYISSRKREEQGEQPRRASLKLGIGVPLSLLAVGAATMLAGCLVPSVPASVFDLGLACVFASIPIWVGIRAGFLASLISIVCLFFLFMLGLPVPRIEKPYPNPVPTAKEEDDRIEEKNPVSVPEFTVRRTLRGYPCDFNASAAVIGLDLAKATSSEKEIADHLYPTFRAALRAARDFECALLPSIDLIDAFSKHFSDRVLEVLEQYVHERSSIFPGGKQGLLAAFLDELLSDLSKPGCDRAAAYLAAAIELGGDDAKVPKNVRDVAKSYVSSFTADPIRSKPVGFYTRTETLQRIFSRDRFLQKPFGTKFWGGHGLSRGSYNQEGLYPVVRMAEVLLRRTDLRRAYKAFRNLAEKLHNPEANLDLEDLIAFNDFFADEGKLAEAVRESGVWEKALARGNVNPNMLGVAFWPFSTSKENRLFARLYQDTKLPRTQAMNDLIWAIREGVLSLVPETDSGWYDYQLYSLETLLLPDRAHESDKLLLHAKYKKRLRKAFEAMLSARRETHVKTVEILPSLGLRLQPLARSPELSLEPCATSYLRTAEAYRFLVGVLKDSLGDAEAESILMEGSNQGILSELNEKTSLFYGFYLTVCSDIGMIPNIRTEEIEPLVSRASSQQGERLGREECLISHVPGLTETERQARFALWKQAKSWLRDLGREAFLDEDMRLVVPVLSNYEGKEVRNWTVLGVQLLKIKVYYARPPTIASCRASGEQNGDDAAAPEYTAIIPSWLRVKWEPRDYVIPIQVFAEVTMGPEPMTREEFRSLCDHHKTKQAILEALTVDSFRRSRLISPPVWIIVSASVGLLVLIAALVLRRRRRAFGSR